MRLEETINRGLMNPQVLRYFAYREHSRLAFEFPFIFHRYYLFAYD